MSSPEESNIYDHPVPPRQVARAVKLSYAQSILSAFSGAAAGGGFVMAYMLKLGASNEQIGLLTTIPMYAVFAQLIAAVLIERGACRKRMTVFASISGMLCWSLVIALPYILAGHSSAAKISGLIAVFTLISVFGHLAGNARASWVGDLIPSNRLGSYFGKLTLYGGFIGAILAITAGRFLDHMKGAGVSAFGWVFAFGMLFGLASASLFIPQPDIKSVKHDLSLKDLVRKTLGNKSLLAFMGFAVLWNMQTIAWPFYQPYLLRDVGLSYTAFSIIGTIQGITVLLTAPYWGRVINRHGCRPVLIICTAITVPCASAFIWLTTPMAAYIGVPIVNIVTGIANGGIGVAISTIIYKVTNATGRAVQMAIYSVVIVFMVAPMPTIGGCLPGWLNAHGIHVDIRCTFYVSQIFALAALLMARRLIEPGSSATGDVVEHLAKKVGAIRED